MHCCDCKQSYSEGFLYHIFKKKVITNVITNIKKCNRKDDDSDSDLDSDDYALCICKMVEPNNKYILK
jgi:hypothetical protein